MTSPVPTDPDAGVIAAGGAVLASVVGGLALWVANRVMGKAAFQTAMNDGWNKLLAATEASRVAAEKEVDYLRKEMAEFKIKSESDRVRLHGEISNLQQVIAALQRELRRANVKVSQPRLNPGDPDNPMLILEDRTEDEENK